MTRTEDQIHADLPAADALLLDEPIAGEPRRPRHVVFAREIGAKSTYTVEIRERGELIHERAKRSIEFCLLLEHIERVRYGSTIEWLNRGEQPGFYLSTLREYAQA